MPIFEYRCQECGHQFELIVFRRDAESTCPVCRSAKTEKLVSGFAMAAGSTKAKSASCGAGRFT